MFRAYLKALLRLAAARYAVKNSSNKAPIRSVEPKYEKFRFALEEMRCPICGRRPHRGLTAQLSQRARSMGVMACGMHGPVKAEIVIALRTNSEARAA